MNLAIKRLSRKNNRFALIGKRYGFILFIVSMLFCFLLNTLFILGIDRGQCQLSGTGLNSTHHQIIRLGITLKQFFKLQCFRPVLKTVCHIILNCSACPCCRIYFDYFFRIVFGEKLLDFIFCFHFVHISKYLGKCRLGSFIKYNLFGTGFELLADIDGQNIGPVCIVERSYLCLTFERFFFFFCLFFFSFVISIFIRIQSSVEQFDLLLRQIKRILLIKHF